MHSFYTKALFFTFFQLLLFATYSQTKLPAEVENKLKGKKKFYEIKDIIEDYFKKELKSIPVNDEKKKKSTNRDRKIWNRYFHDAESRLNVNGEVENTSKKVFEYLNTTSQQASRLSSIAGNWQLAGPSDVSTGIGRVNRIAFDPVDPLTLYAGSAAGGLFKTTSGGVLWSSVSSFLPSLGISGIVVSHANANTIYVLTGDGDAHSSEGFNFDMGFIRYSVGVLKSTDGGTSWQRTGEFPGLAKEQYTGFKLVQDPNNASVLIAATSHGVFRTTSGGNSWTQSTLTGNDSVMVYDLEFKPGSSTTVYASYRLEGDKNDGVFAVSGDGGINFTTSSLYSPNSFSGVQRIAIGVSPANSSHVYLLAGPGNLIADTYKGLWRSTDNGVNFTRQSNSPNVLNSSEALLIKDQNFYDLALAVSPTTASTVITGGLVVFRSTNSGTFFVQSSGYHFDPYIHPDIHDLAYNPLNGHLYAATDGGVAVSSDNGESWTRLFKGLSCTQFYHFAMQDDEGRIWGGTQDNGIIFKVPSSSIFVRGLFSSGDGYDVLTDLAPAGNQDDKYYSINEKIYTDAIADTPDEITPEGADNFFANLAMCPTNEDIIYAGYERLYISYDRGSDWDIIYSTRTEPVSGNWCVEACPSNSKRLYAAGRSDDYGVSIHRLDNFGFSDAINLTSALEDAGYNDNQKITDIAVHPSNSNRVWVTIGGFDDTSKVFYSSDAGETWDNISDGLPNLPTNCALADASGNVYVGTDIGVYYRGSGSTDWTPFYNDLPRVPVTEMEFVTLGETNINIYASTYGRGIWYSNVYSDCPSTLTINQGLQGQQFYQAGTTISSTSLINGAAGTSVFFKAGTEVILIPGFESVAGTEFKAYVGPCDNEVPAKIIPLPANTEKSKLLKSNAKKEE